MTQLRNQLVRLAYHNPEIRPQVLPLLKEGKTKEAAGLSFRGLLDKIKPRDLAEAQAFVRGGQLDRAGFKKHIENILMGSGPARMASLKNASVSVEALEALEEVKGDPGVLSKGEAALNKLVNVRGLDKAFLYHPKKMVFGIATAVTALASVLGGVFVMYFGSLGFLSWVLGAAVGIALGKWQRSRIESLYYQYKDLPVESQPPLIAFAESFWYRLKA